MRPLSYQLLTMTPAALALVVLFLCAAPIDGVGLTYTPNVAWLATLVMVPFYPQGWPRGWAFLLGLLQDVLFGTPLGSQALLSVLLAQFAYVQAGRQQTPPFRARWLEAAGMLVLWHILLWALMHAIMPGSASLHGLLRAGLVSAVWYPLFYGLVTRAFSALPDVK